MKYLTDDSRRLARLVAILADRIQPAEVFDTASERVSRDSGPLLQIRRAYR